MCDSIFFKSGVWVCLNTRYGSKWDYGNQIWNEDSLILTFFNISKGVLNQKRPFKNRKGCSKTRKGYSKTGKDVLKQEKCVLKQEKTF